MMQREQDLGRSNLNLESCWAKLGSSASQATCRWEEEGVHVLVPPWGSSKSYQQTYIHSLFAGVDIFMFSGAEQCSVPLEMGSVSLTLLSMHP